MKTTPETLRVLEPRRQSTRALPESEGLHIEPVTSDSTVLFAFVAGVVITACVFLATRLVIHH